MCLIPVSNQLANMPSVKQKDLARIPKMKESENTGHCLATLLGLTQGVIVTGEWGFLPSMRDGSKPNGICRSPLMPFSVSTRGEKRLKLSQGTVRVWGIHHRCQWCPTTRKEMGPGCRSGGACPVPPLDERPAIVPKSARANIKSAGG